MPNHPMDSLLEVTEQLQADLTETTAIAHSIVQAYQIIGADCRRLGIEISDEARVQMAIGAASVLYEQNDFLVDLERGN